MNQIIDRWSLSCTAVCYRLTILLCLASPIFIRGFFSVPIRLLPVWLTAVHIQVSQNLPVVQLMHRVAKPEVHRRELGELPQGSLNAPAGEASCGAAGLLGLLPGHIIDPDWNIVPDDPLQGGSAAGVVLGELVPQRRLVLFYPLQAGSGRCRIGLLLHDLRGQLQLHQIQHGIRVTGKHAGSRCPIHGPLASLGALGVVVAVDHGAAKLRADLVKLVAEGRHLVGAVFVAGNDLINGVDDHGDVVLLQRPPDELRGQRVHGQRLAPEIPDIDIADIGRPQPHSLIHILKPVQAASSVQLQVDIEHLSLGALPLQPLLALGNGNAQLDQCKGLARLGRPGDQHLMALPQHTLDQAGGQSREVIPVVLQPLKLRQIVVGTLYPFLPGFPGFLSNIGIHQKLLVPPPGNAGHSGQPGGVLVLGIQGKAVLFENLIEVVNPAAVLGVVRGINPHNSVEALPAAVYQAGNRQLQLPQKGVLLGNGHIVGFHQRVSKLGDVLILHALAVQGVEANPGPSLRLVVSQGGPQVIPALTQGFNQLPGGTVIAALGWQIFFLLLPAFRHVAYIFIGIKQDFQVRDQLLGGVPLLGHRDLSGFHPSPVHHR